LGVPTSNGISLTQSGIFEVFWVITGTTSDHKLSKDVSLASQSSATLVILMGMHKLDETISIYQYNRTDYLPFAIIQIGTKVYEIKVLGTINSTTEFGEVLKHSFNLATFYQEEFSNDDFILQNLNSSESVE
jgi:uroporphyrin-III C-methyltransferase